MYSTVHYLYVQYTISVVRLLNSSHVSQKPLVRSCSEPVEWNSLLDIMSSEIRFNIIFLSTHSTCYFMMTLLSEGYSVPGSDAV